MSWTLTVVTTSPSETFNVILDGTTINIDVVWGDLSSNNYTVGGTKTHTFAAAGTYYVEISGALTGTIGKVIFYTASGNTSNKIKATAAITSVTGIATTINMFRNSGLTSLPNELFKGCTSMNNTSAFNTTFYNCTGLTSLPSDLFKYNTGITSGAFTSTFYNCTGLTSLPSDLFKYNVNITTSAFGSTFQECTGLTSLPSDLFRYNTLITSNAFNTTFRGCTGLASLPSDLFRYNTGITTGVFTSTFYGCTGLTSLPSDLFEHNTLITNFSFYYTFQNCSGLTSIPSDLFEHNINATSYVNCFYGCINLQGLAPELWNLVPEPTGTDCFYSDVNLSNYGDIPADWGGGGDENTSSSSLSTNLINSTSSLSSNSSKSSASSNSSSSLESAIGVYNIIVSQNNVDIIPFWLITESGFEDESNLNFTIASTANNIDYNTIVGQITSPINNPAVPEDQNNRYKHNNIVYIDVMSTDPNGIKNIASRTQEEIYEYETPKIIFNAPKFSWTNTVFNEDISSESSFDVMGYVWIGSSDKAINKIQYTNEIANNVFQISTTSEVYKISFGSENSDVYLTEYDVLSRCSIDSYWPDTIESQNILEINNDNNMISYANNTNIISTDSYHGNVIIRNRETMDIQSTFSGFDAPFKVIWSKYHNCYFVAGTDRVWQLQTNGTKKSIYQIAGYKIKDIDCSEKGRICILFSGTADIIRVLDKNLYSIIVNSVTSDTKLKFCKYCKNEILYVLGEKGTYNSYDVVNYVIDANKNTIDKYDSNSKIVTTTTTTTLPLPTSKVQISYPDGGENLLKNTTQVIEWISNASINDSISIQLLKGNHIYQTISDNAKNTGTYSWEISNTYPSSSDYKIKLTWLAPGDTHNYDISATNFSIVDIETTTTTTTTTKKILNSSIGIDYSSTNNVIVIVLANGLIGFFNLNTLEFNGLFDSGIRNVNCMAINDNEPIKNNSKTKVRIFVGSAPYLNDKWDSGIVETTLDYMYYCGGNNLDAGETYYINLQIYSEIYGWSEIQTKEFIMNM